MAQGPIGPAQVLQASARPEPEILQAPEHPGPPDAWEVYLVGHGYTMTGYDCALVSQEQTEGYVLAERPHKPPKKDPVNAKDAAAAALRAKDEADKAEFDALMAASKSAPIPRGWFLKVPSDIWVAFYVAEFGVFDKAMEQPILNHQWQEEVEWVEPRNPTRVCEHILSYPSLETGFTLRNMVNIYKPGFDLNNGKGNPDTVSLQLSRELHDRDGMYVGHGRPLGKKWGAINERGICRGNYALLSDILELISEKHTPTLVHWFACRGRWEGSASFYAQTIGSSASAGDFGRLTTEQLTSII